jgi:hypothetical protein
VRLDDGGGAGWLGQARALGHDSYSAKRRTVTMSKTLTDLMTETILNELAGERAFERGANYFADGHVVGLKEENGAITARVRGTYYYRVRLWTEGEMLAFECACPVEHAHQLVGRTEIEFHSRFTLFCGQVREYAFAAEILVQLILDRNDSRDVIPEKLRRGHRCWGSVDIASQFFTQNFQVLVLNPLLVHALIRPTPEPRHFFVRPGADGPIPPFLFLGRR